MTATVTLVGAAHPAARALAPALEADPAVERVIGLDTNEPPVLGPKFEYVPAREGSASPPSSAGATSSPCSRRSTRPPATATARGGPCWSWPSRCARAPRRAAPAG